MTRRALIIGALLSGFIGLGGAYNRLVLHASFMTMDHTAGASIFLLFILVALINPLAKRINSKFSLRTGEVLGIYIMMLVACAIPTSGLVQHFLPLLPSPWYLASSENRWVQLIHPHLKRWLFPQGEETIRCFFEGLPINKYVPVPYRDWIGPLLMWGIFFLSLYFVMICIMSILRKQWVENERLIYPTMHLPLEMANEQGSSFFNPFFRNKVMWFGFAIPFLLGTLRALHGYFHFLPDIITYWDIPIFRNTNVVKFNLSFPMLGFGFLISSGVSFSIWFMHLLYLMIRGAFDITGISPDLGRCGIGGQAIFNVLQTGGMIALAGSGLWMARVHIKTVFKKAFFRDKGLEIDESREILSYRTSVWGMILGILVMVIWLWISGISFWISLSFVLFALLIFLAITRIICESGMVAIHNPLYSTSGFTTFVGSSNISHSSLVNLAFTTSWYRDIRSLVMVNVASGLKLVEEIKKKKKLMFWAIMVAIVISLVSSLWTSLKLCYVQGASTVGNYFFVVVPQSHFNYSVISQLKSPVGANWLAISITAAGSVIMLLLTFLRYQFLWWPLHPIGFPICGLSLTSYAWFSFFIAWLIKAIILRYGGPKIYRSIRPFFLGLIMGQFVCSGVWAVIDFFVGKIGNSIFCV